MTGGPPVVLIGPMAAGKNRVGKRVARILGTGFQDTDRMIVADHGAIPAIFDEHGEAHFRALERDAVARALASDDVVALGGGAVLAPETQALLASHRVVLVTERLPIYEKLALLTVDTSHRPIDAVAREVAEWSTQTA
jgi:shikimate kinase